MTILSQNRDAKSNKIAEIHFWPKKLAPKKLKFRQFRLSPTASPCGSIFSRDDCAERREAACATGAWSRAAKNKNILK